MKNQNTTTDFVEKAFEHFFDEPASPKTPWERSNMSYEEWHKMYEKAMDDSRKLEESIKHGWIM